MIKRVVVKIGTKVLLDDGGTLDVEFLKQVVDQIVTIRKKGLQVVLVTSGAGGAGRSLVSLKNINSQVTQKQVFAAIGQVKLMGTYAALFAEHGYLCAQVLATKEDFRDEAHYKNMENCFEGLLLDNVVPVVNENDVVATTELLFTDNDELAGLVARQLNADEVILLTSTEGVLNDLGELVPEITLANFEKVKGYVTPDKSTGGRGGMSSKFAVAESLAKEKISVHVVNGRTRNIILRVLDGEQVGTVFRLW